MALSIYLFLLLAMLTSQKLYAIKGLGENVYIKPAGYISVIIERYTIKHAIDYRLKKTTFLQFTYAKLMALWVCGKFFIVDSYIELVLALNK